MNRAAFSILALVAAVAAVRADDQPKPQAYELKNRSTFEVDRNARSPFWPIGWRKDLVAPALVAKIPEVKMFQIQPQHFKVSSVLLGNPPVAIINGRGFGEGELLPVIVGDLPVQVVVRQIRDGGVWLEQGTHRVFVPLKREALTPRGNSPTTESKEEFKIQIPEK